MNSLNLNPQIGFALGHQTCKKIERLPKIPSIQVSENEALNLLEYIKSNYKKLDSSAPDYTKQTFPLIFRTEVNSDPVLVLLTNRPFASFALRINNSFSTAIGSINTRIWTKYTWEEQTEAWVDMTKECFQQIAEITFMYADLKNQIDNLGGTAY